MEPALSRKTVEIRTKDNGNKGEFAIKKIQMMRCGGSQLDGEDPS
jgi:hypothetical protein